MIDQQRITDAIVALNVSPLSKETGANLVDEWIRAHHDEDSKYEIAAVELGFVLDLDPHTIAIGVQDVVMKDGKGYFGNEWKNVKAPRKDARGRDSSWWNENVWLREISTGPQVGLYALALSRGRFYDRTGAEFNFAVQNPRVRVRAAVKANPVRFWPSEDSGESGVFSFDESALDSIKSGFLAKAEQIRCARRGNRLPWQLPGHQCFPFNRTCVFLDKFCAKHEPPEVLEGEDKVIAIFDPSDPAAQLAIPHIDPARLDDPELVLLSASSYSTASECLEKYRIISGSIADKTEDDSKSSVEGRDVGTVAHAGYAEYYRMLKEDQEAAPK